MAGKLKLILTLVCALAVSTLVMSCAPSNNASTFTGEWEFLYGSPEGLNKEEVDKAKSLGETVTLTLNDDGTGTLDLYGDVSSLTWTATSETAGSITVEGNNAASASIEDELLTLSKPDDSTLTFGRPPSEDE